MTLRVFKCSFCGYIFRADPEKTWRDSPVIITREKRTSRPVPAEHRRTVDLTCPNCGGDFEVEVEG